MLQFFLYYMLVFALVGHILLIQKLIRNIRFGKKIKSSLTAPAPASVAPAEEQIEISDEEKLNEQLTTMLKMFQNMNGGDSM